MPRSPSIVPGDPDVYLVLDDLGKLGRVWREVDAETTDYETVISDLLTGQYKSPVRVISFNLEERWARDVSREVAEDLLQRSANAMQDLPQSLQAFVESGRFRKKV